jgi:hypothetical protein
VGAIVVGVATGKKWDKVAEIGGVDRSWKICMAGQAFWPRA